MKISLSFENKIINKIEPKWPVRVFTTGGHQDENKNWRKLAKILNHVSVSPQDHRLRWVDHYLVLPTTTNVVRPHTMARGRRSEGEQSIHTQQRHQRWPELCIGDGKSELSLLGCSGKLYIQLYPSSPSTAAILLQWLDMTAGLTLAPAPVVATVRQVSRSAPALAAATVPQ